VNIQQHEREKYENIWQTDQYNESFSPGEKYLPLFLDMTGRGPKTGFQGAHVLDAGCGAGKGALALLEAGFRVSCADVTDAGLLPALRDSLTVPFHTVCLWNSLRALGWFDYVYCTDVLEHIPPQFTMLVVARLLALVRQELFLSIAFVPDVMGVWVGKPLHETVQPFVWWRDNLASVGELVQARDLIDCGAFLLRPRLTS
jgi:2-polyprenyl-3-methyl-5-hydroxy-6-metoxy-1,4-benzoquinol methylase